LWIRSGDRRRLTPTLEVTSAMMPACTERRPAQWSHRLVVVNVASRNRSIGRRPGVERRSPPCRTSRRRARRGPPVGRLAMIVGSPASAGDVDPTHRRGPPQNVAVRDVNAAAGPVGFRRSAHRDLRAGSTVAAPSCHRESESLRHWPGGGRPTTVSALSSAATSHDASAARTLARQANTGESPRNRRGSAPSGGSRLDLPLTITVMDLATHRGLLTTLRV
jgi:hypothetical protein